MAISRPKRGGGGGGGEASSLGSALNMPFVHLLPFNELLIMANQLALGFHCTIPQTLDQLGCHWTKDAGCYCYCTRAQLSLERCDCVGMLAVDGT